MDDLTKFVVGLIIIIAGAVWLWGTAPKGTNKKYIIFSGQVVLLLASRLLLVIFFILLKWGL